MFKPFHVIKYCAMVGLFAGAASLAIASSPPHERSIGMPMQHDSQLRAFPAPAPGQKQFVITLPPQQDEWSFRVGLLVGRNEITDGVNRVRIAGALNEKNLQGWGYTYYQVDGAEGPSVSTLIGVPPGRPKVMKFTPLPEKIVRYNSRLPLVIYAPDNFEVRYRIFSAGAEHMAPVVAEGPKTPPPASGMSSEVYLKVDRPARLPAGSMATVRLYDSLLMDTDSTYAVHTVPVTQLPVKLPLPQVTRRPFVAGPAVGVTIRDANNRLIYWNDTTTPINTAGSTVLEMKRP